jgi:tetratricopeptide (TPR) repeat protein
MKYLLLLLIVLFNNLLYSQSENLKDDAYDLYNNGKYAEALGLITTFLKSHPNDVEGIQLRADTKYSLKDYAGAMVDYTNAIKINSKDPSLFDSRADAKYGLKDFAGAVEDYNKALLLQRTIDSIRGDGVETMLPRNFYTISKLNVEALKNNRPQLGKFNASLNYMEKILSNGLNANDLYRHIFDVMVSWEEKTYLEYNDKTNEHDLPVYEAVIELKYKGSPIIITIQCDSVDKRPIKNIQYNFRCQCDWYNVKDEALKNGFTQISYVDSYKNEPLSAGMSIKFKKGIYDLHYEKYYSRLLKTVFLKSN